jgi:hypothetical protein
LPKNNNLNDIITGPEELVPLKRVKLDFETELANTPDSTAWARARRVDLQEKLCIVRAILKVADA